MVHRRCGQQHRGYPRHQRAVDVSGWVRLPRASAAQLRDGQKRGREMTDITEDLRGLLDRERIRDCIARLARGEDRRDATLISASYWPDSTSDYGVFEGSFDK